MSTEPTPEQVLALPLDQNDANAATVREYLIELLRRLWRETDLFSGKRPFGYSSWPYDLYLPMVKAGFAHGTFDADGDLDDVDTETADALIDKAILALGGAR